MDFVENLYNFNWESSVGVESNFEFDAYTCRTVEEFDIFLRSTVNGPGVNEGASMKHLNYTLGEVHWLVLLQV